ncbi:hypothetical protein V6N11_083326 [Hibiscus sabdariffa]|uniref:DNA/RNA-binding protein Alba-like domain-containing protein n=1 Tax=Hibiscus sabdariffa TaxID=183260 RepID=A0ABR2QLL9_9ROSI
MGGVGYMVFSDFNCRLCSKAEVAGLVVHSSKPALIGHWPKSKAKLFGALLSIPSDLVPDFPCLQMAKGSKGRRGIAFRRFRPTPYSFTSRNHLDISEDLCPKECSKALDKKDWEDTTCSVCMECPHNAVLLLCSSHDKGCRPYMCGTSFRYSNCLDQYKKFYTKVVLSDEDEPLLSSVDNPVLAPGSVWPVEKCQVAKLACPLCRGQVKGWTVLEPAREYFNTKKRSCMQDDCTFVGTFKELRKHMRSDHPCSQPREVDPVLEQKWRRLVREREQEDVISIIRSTIPGAMVFGDYVIEGNHHGLNADAAERNGGFEASLDINFVFLLLHAFGPSGNDLGRQPRQPTHAADENTVGLSDPHDNSFSDTNDDGGNVSLVSRLRQRRRARRDATGEQISKLFPLSHSVSPRITMDRYQKVEKPKAETPINENELRITAQGRMRNYISYAITLFQEKAADEILLKATGRAINKTVMIAELIKRRIAGLHQNTLIGSIDITDTWEPLEEGLLPLETTRHVSIITITLSKKELDSSSIGYQPPIPADQVKPLTEFEDNEGGNANGGMAENRNGGYDGGRGYGARQRGRGRGRSFRGRGRGYGGGNMQWDSGYNNGDGPSGPLPSQGRGRGRGRGRSRGRGRGRAQGFVSDGPFQKGA